MACHLGVLKRLNKEYSDLQANQESVYWGFSAGPKLGDKIFPEWDGYIFGLDASPYEGGIFHLSILFPTDYPFKPPKVRFVTKIVHCNVDKEGYITLDVLRRKWAPSLTVRAVLMSIRALMDDPNPDDPLVPSLAAILKRDPQEYYKVVREATLKYATPARLSDTESESGEETGT